jgi:molybdate transport repressor ModE-like protein
VEQRPLDWDRLRVFQAVAEAGSISAAATQLGVSPAKVSRDIEELEYSLGQKLFSRSTRGMEITTTGGAVLKSTQSMADSARAIASYVRDATDSGAPRRITIAAYEGFATYWLARRLPAFQRANPGFEIVLKVVQETPSVAAGDADISIQYEAPTSPNVFSKQLGWVHYILYASPAYLEAHGVPETMFDLGKHRFLLYSGFNKQMELWEPKTPAWMEVINHAVQSNSGGVVLESCASGGGIALLPTYVSEIERRLQPLTHIRPLAAIRFWLTYTEQVRNSPQYEPVVRWLRECFDTTSHPCFLETYVQPSLLEAGGELGRSIVHPDLDSAFIDHELMAQKPSRQPQPRNNGREPLSR